MTLRVRTRLTLWYTGIFLLVLGVYVAAEFVFKYAQLSDQINRDEIQEVEAVEGLLYFSSDGRLLLHDQYYSHPQSLLLVHRLLEVHDMHGNVLLRSPALNGHELGRPSFRNEGAAWFERRIARLSDGREVLFTSHLHPVNGQSLLIRLGYDLAPLHERMLHFLYLLLLALPPSVLVAAWAGYRLSRTAFRPLEEMAVRAEQISAKNLHDRLVIAEPDGDELGRMGHVVNDLLERLDQAFRQLQRFTADVAHELRTPLASLRASGEEALMAAPGNPGPNLSSVIGNMLEETERLTQTINGLLLLSRVENGSPNLELSTFTLPEIVEEVLALLDVLLDEHDLDIRIENAAQSHGTIHADRTLIRSTLMNVLHNAIKYSPPQTTIRLVYTQMPGPSGAMQQLCIEDQGPGLAAGEHARIFDRFYRGTVQASGASAGLGLSIAKIAVEYSGGRIFADETHVGGLRCCICLPIFNAQTDPEA